MSGGRRRILLSAFSCRPGKGSEPGLGWNLARALAARYDVWVLTVPFYRREIEAALERDPVPGLTFEFHDLPLGPGSAVRGKVAVAVYYYLWQLAAGRRARALHRRVGFDLVHHVTFAKYWAPVPAGSLPPPFLWGPVGGGESAPPPFRRRFSAAGRRFEALRDVGRRLEEFDPLVRRTARAADLVLATTPETAARIRRLTDRPVEVQPGVALAAADVRALGALAPSAERARRFLSMGELRHLKGFDLGLEAFARSGAGDSEYWIVGDGPERARLEALVDRLGIASRVRFWGMLPRREALERLAETDVLIHPVLHDSGGWVCLEAMAAGRPVVCLDLGGPAEIVTPESGRILPAESPAQVVKDLAETIDRMAAEPGLARGLGAGGRSRIAERFTFERRVEDLAERYERLWR